MAKRKKKLNKKLVIALSAVTVLLLLVIGVGVALNPRILYRFRDILIPVDPVPHAKAGLEALDKKDYETAVEEMSTAIRAIRGKSVEDRESKAVYYYDLGRIYLEWFKEGEGLTDSQKRDYLQKCLGAMRQATTLNRNYLEPHQTLYTINWQFTQSELRRRRGDVDWTRFIEAASNLLRIDSKNEVAYFRRGIALSRVGERNADSEDWKKGLADFRKAIELEADNVPYWSAWLGLLTWAEPRDAKIDVSAGFKEAFKANPNSAALRIQYAGYLRRRDRSDEAEEQLREAVKCEPTSPSGHISMARFLMKSEQYDAAFEHLNNAEKCAKKALAEAKVKRKALEKALEEDEAKRKAIEKALTKAERDSLTLAGVYLQRSMIHRVKRKLDKSVEVLQEGIAEMAPELSAAETQPASRRTIVLPEQMNRLNFALANAALDHAHTITDKKLKADMEVVARKCLDKLDNLPKDSPHRAKIAGRLAIVRGDRETAVKELERAYRVFGLADLQTPALLITLYDTAGMPGKAEKLLTSLQNAPRLQDSVEVLLALVRLKMRYKDYEAADNFVDRALRAEAQNEAALQLKGELRLLMGKSVTIAQAETLSAAGVRSMVEQAESKWVEGQKKEALAMLVNLRKALPKNLLLAERAINMYLLQGDKNSAKAIVAEMLAAYPENDELKFQSQLLDKTPEQRLALRMDRLDKQVTDPFVLAWAKARMAHRAGRKDLQKKFLAAATALKPNNPAVTGLQFRQALSERNWDAALAAVQRITKINELRGKSMHADLLFRQKQYDKALEILTPLRKSHPDSKFILRMLGQCYLATNKDDMAADVFGVLESIDPGDAGALIGLAIVTQRQGRMAENEGYITRAYRLPAAKNNPYVKGRYLEIRESKATGDEIKSLIQQREALHKAGPRDPNYLDNLLRLARLCEYRTKDLAPRAGELYNEAYQRTGRSLRWGRTLAFFYARNGSPAKGEAVIKEGVNAAKNTRDKVAWLVMHGEFLTMYSPDQALRAYNRASKLDPKNPLPFRAKAELYARVGQWQEAIKHMAAYVAIRGEDIRGRKTLIQYRINARQYDQAGKAIEELLSRNPTDAQALLLKAVLLRLSGSPAKAITVATQAIDKHPEFAAAFSVRARAYLVMGELGMAKNDLESARTLSKTPEISMELVDIYTRLGRDGDAILVLKSIIAEHKTHETALRKLINIYLQAKDWANAERTIAQAHKLFPGKPTYLMIEADMWRSRRQTARYIAALEKAFALGKESMLVVRTYLLGLLGVQAYDKALAVAVSYRDRPLWSVWINAVIGRIMVAKKQPRQAGQLFFQAVEKARADELSFVVSQIREAYGPKVAIEQMIAASRANPANWYIRVLVGDLCSAIVGDPRIKLAAADRSQYLKLAIDNYNTALGKTEKPAGIAMLSNRLGKVYYDKGDTRNSEKAYMECLKIAPNDIAALNNLAYLYVDDLDKPEKALPYIQKVYKLMPQDPNVLDTYGWVLGKLKRYAEAKKYLQRSIERDPELVAARYHLGWVFEQTGDPKRALMHYRLGMEMVRTKPHLPLHKWLQGALKRLGA